MHVIPAVVVLLVVLLVVVVVVVVDRAGSGHKQLVVVLVVLVVLVVGVVVVVVVVGGAHVDDVRTHAPPENVQTHDPVHGPMVVVELVVELVVVVVLHGPSGRRTGLATKLPSSGIGSSSSAYRGTAVHPPVETSASGRAFWVTARYLVAWERSPAAAWGGPVRSRKK
ncbi:hypothetical protein [Fimbriiglobus ruber]|uniref:hypothetical protein n=1 Tax=Fimbriiglobus ruber TaxID=1908690 RepID=UPI001179ACAF|nr:hypothetical protein [Fimbriiglobus ruber]